MATLRRTGPCATIVVVTLALLGCGGPADGAPVVEASGGTPVPFDTVLFDAQAYGRPFAALSTEPVDMGLFADWYAWPGWDDSQPPTVPKAGQTLLVVADTTGCRLATGIDVRRAGDDLEVTFTGDAHPPAPGTVLGCARAFGPVALLSIPTDAVAGVRTVNGGPPVTATGPGVLTGFVRLDGGPPAAVELGTPAATALAASKERNRAAVAALERPVRPGTRAFGFVVTGCQDTGAVLLISADRLTAEATGGEGTSCDQPEYFLATFEVAADLVPVGAVPGE